MGTPQPLAFRSATDPRRGGFWFTTLLLPHMSASEDTFADIRQAFLRGDIGPDELRDRLEALDDDTDREELWARWADQGLFDDPIDQDGYTSFAGARIREVDRDGVDQA